MVYSYRLFSPPSRNDSDKLNYLFDYVGSTYITESAYTSQKLTQYCNLTNDDLIIDGAFGEMWRREFLTRLFWAGQKIVEEKNITEISNAVSTPVLISLLRTYMQKCIQA